VLIGLSMMNPSEEESEVSVQGVMLVGDHSNVGLLFC
jgi:hypothetical protein